MYSMSKLSHQGCLYSRCVTKTDRQQTGVPSFNENVLYIFKVILIELQQVKKPRIKD